MTELYRGLLFVLTSKFNELIEAFRVHVRSFNLNTSDPENFLDLGVLGFWNFILEVIFTLFCLSGLVIGVLLTVNLAIVSYPFSALLKYSSKLLYHTRNGNKEEIQIIKIKDDSDKEEKK